ncbi:MAG TPA: choice-of-anchor tandem repeat GloVer-containing protein, partial [Rhizomicrobium sp.]|nr:choice-of-anchor tandem repeat GloVer-containing protein [Rhizomicrobium sp.]
LGGIALLAAVSAAGASGLQTIHSFCATPQDGCSDGASPSNLTRDAAGNLFGTTPVGGTGRAGTIFELSRDPETGDWTYRVIYSFCADGSCTESPSSPLIVDTAGNLYGTAYNTVYGAGYGGIYKLSPNRNGTKWRYDALHKFNADGYMSESALTYAGAASGLSYDGVSPLYGASALGGENRAGNIYMLTPKSGVWHFKIIHRFCETDCSDGSAPFATPILDEAGNLYGATVVGGQANSGVVFKLSRSRGTWSETVLYDFCSAANCADGEMPRSLIMDAAGNLLGTTLTGGQCNTPGYCGVAFKITPDGRESTLYAFCAKRDCGDGSFPFSALNMNANGKLYGTTMQGGGHDTDPGGVGGGTVFALGDHHRVLYRFCAQAACADGYYPSSTLLPGGQGNFFGVTQRGGATDGGTVFELTP